MSLLKNIFVPRTMRQALLRVVFLIVVPLLLVQVGIYWSWYDVREATQVQTNAELAQAMGNTFEEFLRDICRQEQSTGSTLIEIKPSPEKIGELLVETARDYPEVRSWSWADPDGAILGTTEPGYFGKSISDRQYYKDIVAGKEWAVSDLLTCQVTSNPVFVIAHGIRDKAGVLRGIMVAAIYPHNLDHLTIWNNTRDEGTFTVFDRQGNLMYCRPDDKNQVLKSWKESDPLLAEILRTGRTQTGREITPMDNRERFVSRVPVGDTGWVAGFARPVSVSMAVVEKELWIVVLINIGVIGLSIIGVITVSRVIVSPLDRLSKHAVALGQGRFDSRTDISGLRELENLATGFNTMAEQLQNRQRQLDAIMDDLKRSNQELEQFAYVASHDLQEPLRVVTGYTQLIERRYKGKLDANADEFIAFITDAVERMRQLINDLLAYSRIDTQGKPFGPIDTGKVMNDVVNNLGQAIHECNAKVTYDPMPTVSADRMQLMQLFQNLISNSLKFHSPDRAAEVHVSAKEDAAAWVFSVSDNGIGIDSAYWERIFVIFQRLHTREKYVGTGIGLAICKKIVARHGGRIWLESTPGKGSTFFFTIKKRETQ